MHIKLTKNFKFENSWPKRVNYLISSLEIKGK